MTKDRKLIRELKAEVQAKAKDGKVIMYTDVEMIQLYRESGLGISVGLEPLVDYDIDVEVEIEVDKIIYRYDAMDNLVFMETKDGAEIKVIRFV